MINPLVGPASCRFRQIQADDVNMIDISMIAGTFTNYNLYNHV